MALRLLIFAGWITALLVPQAVQAVNIKQCAMVANGSARVIGIRAQASDGRMMTLKGILYGDASKRKRPALVMLPGSQGLVVPYCYGAIARQFAEWGIITLTVAPTTARDQSGSRHLNYSFSDLARYAFGAAGTLADLAQVDGKRVGLWGHSRGGLSAIEAVTSAIAGQLPFNAAVAIAPICPARARPTHIPTLLMIGEKDTEVSVKSCVKFAGNLENVSTFEFQLLPNAGHIYWASGMPGYDAASAETARLRLKRFLAKNRLYPP